MAGNLCDESGFPLLDFCMAFDELAVSADEEELEEDDEGAAAAGFGAGVLPISFLDVGAARELDKPFPTYL